MKRSRAVLEWLEEGRQEGEQLGLQKGERLGQLEFLEAALESKFGPLPADVLAHLRALPAEALKAIPRRLFAAASLADLGL